MTPTHSTPTGPLDIGNVVTAAIRLYRSHLKAYLKIALIATLWLLVPLLVLIPLVILAIAVGQDDPAIMALGIFLAVLISLIVSLFCIAKSLMNIALIARLAFGELVQQPESISRARQALKPKLWGFLGIQFLANLILLVTSFAISIIQAIVFGGLSLLFQDILALNLLISLIGNLVYFAVYFWVYARLSIPDLPIAVEENIRASDSVGRSWELTQSSTIRIIGVLSVALFITLPLYILAAVPAIAWLAVLFPSISAIEPDGWSPFVIAQLIGVLLVGLLLFFVANLAVTPLWQTIKAVLYYDLRSRREGLDLQLRDRDPI